MSKKETLFILVIKNIFLKTRMPMSAVWHAQHNYLLYPLCFLSFFAINVDHADEIVFNVFGVNTAKGKNKYCSENGEKAFKWRGNLRDEC